MNSPERVPLRHKPFTGYLVGCGCARWYDCRRVHRGVLGRRSHHADRLVRPFRGAAAMGLQGTIMNALLALDFGARSRDYRDGVQR